MKRSLLLAYQWITGLFDTLTGALLCVAPEFTLRLMGVHGSSDIAPYLAYIGAFVFSVGLACLYGVVLFRYESFDRLEVVWLLTAISRSAVAIYVLKAILAGTLETGWISVAAFYTLCVGVQAIGLRHRWLAQA
jgi:hypothetical protein